MKHLRLLKIFNRVFAILYFLLGLAVLYFLYQALQMGSGGTVMVTLIISILIVGLGVFHWMVGSQLVLGRGRIGQTVLAVLNLASAPIGTAYGVYALYVCWMNDETKRVFDNPEAHLGDLESF